MKILIHMILIIIIISPCICAVKQFFVRTLNFDFADMLEILLQSVYNKINAKAPRHILCLGAALILLVFWRV